MANITDPFPAVAQTKLTATQMNARFSTVIAAINGGIDTTNISPSAGIQPSQLNLTQPYPFELAANTVGPSVGTTGDTAPRVALSSNGGIFFGPGGSTATDTALSRESAGRLQISNAGGTANAQLEASSFSVRNFGDANDQTTQTSAGLIFGAGGASAQDVSIVRSSAGTLAIRNAGNSADAALTASTGVFSGELTAGLATGTGLHVVANAQVDGNLNVTGTISSSSTTNEPALQLLGGSATPGGAAALPTYKNYDSAVIFGGGSNIRPLPTSGTITGEYWHSGNWTQTGAITSNYARIHIAGTMTINNTWTVNTEMPGGQPCGPQTSGVGSNGAGLSGGPGGFYLNGIYLTGGSGGSFGGAGGKGGSEAAGTNNPPGPGAYSIAQSLSGSGGGGGSSGGNAGAPGGAGGGSLYVESTGNITVTSGGAIAATGATGTAATAANGGSGGAGSGGGIQVRCLGTFANAGSITAPGGVGGSGSTSSVPGGGGGGGCIDISSTSTTNTGTISAPGGAAGTNGSGTAATAGSTGIVNLNSFVQNVRSAN